MLKKKKKKNSGARVQGARAQPAPPGLGQPAHQTHRTPELLPTSSVAWPVAHPKPGVLAERSGQPRAMHVSEVKLCPVTEHASRWPEGVGYTRNPSPAQSQRFRFPSRPGNRNSPAGAETSTRSPECFCARAARPPRRVPTPRPLSGPALSVWSAGSPAAVSPPPPGARSAQAR